MDNYSIIIIFIIGLYIILLNKNVPTIINQLFSNNLFKIIILLIIISLKNYILIILLLFAYILTINHTHYMNTDKINKSFSLLSKRS